jgi:NAD(P)-dependent dehydrogenase (short-subunit alcohol dehydrogenase family)
VSDAGTTTTTTTTSPTTTTTGSESNKTVLITGAGTGFGKGTAEKLVAAGHRVIGGCLTEDEAAGLTAIGAEPIRLDITDDADLAAVADLAAAEPIDVLLNNAGRGQLGPLATVALDKVRQVFEVNVFGTLQVTQAVLPSMMKRRSGRVIVVSSIAGVSSGTLSGPYAMTKHALEAFTRSLRLEMQPYDVEVCKLNPGPYATGFNDAMVDGVQPMIEPDTPERDLADSTRERMLGNQLDPVEIVDTMVELCTAETVPFETFKPDNILERYNLPPRPTP